MIPSKQTQNKINLARTLHQIWRHQGISRSEIARKLELDKSTITDAIQKLIEARLVEEWKHGDSRPGGGRKPIFLRVSESFGLVVGLEFRPESFRVVYYSLRGEVLDSFSGTQDVGPRDFLSSLSQLIRTILSRALAGNRQVIAIGIGLSGIIESSTGRILHSIPFGIDSPKQVADELMSEHGIPVLLENDANACAWSELGFFSERISVDPDEPPSEENPIPDPHSYIAVLGEVPALERDSRLYAFSVGLGLCINQRIYRGPNHYAGEFRSLNWNGEPEGQFGPLKDELRNFRSNPSLRRRVFEELASQIALFSNTLDCDAVYLCGHLESYTDEFIPILDRCIRQNWSYEDVQPREVELLPSSHGENAVAVGAAALILHILFGVPDYATVSGNQNAKIRDIILGSLASTEQELPTLG